MAAPNEPGGKFTKHERRRLKKENKAKFTLFRHEQIQTVDVPTTHLVVGNGGFGNNVQYEQLYELFSPYGHVVDIQLKPRKPYAFVSFETPDEAKEALLAVHGKMLDESTTSTAGLKLYLAFVESLPVEDSTSAVTLPQGLQVLENFVSEETEQILLNCVDWTKPDKHLLGGGKQTLKHRRVKHYGYEFRYDINNVDKQRPLEWGIPAECDEVVDAIMKTGHVSERPDQLTVNKYQPGQGIPPHVDTHSAFQDEIISLGLGSQVVMEFRHPDGRHIPVLVPRRTLVIMTGESRYLWSHGITPRKSDLIPVGQMGSRSGPHQSEGETASASNDESSGGGAAVVERSSKTLTLLNRGVRTSFTFRKIRPGQCYCKYPNQCDTQRNESKPSIDPDAGLPSMPQCSSEAASLEHTHVHQVYEEIAGHFSATRHSAWPQVEEFLQKLPPGSVVADIGCGNGKYMLNQPHLCMVGSDRSMKLCEICAERNLQVMVCDILAVPLREGAFDAAVCIAVIHHLATPERRLAAVQQILKVLRPGGQALLYVWALEQERKNIKSNYLSDSRVRNKKDLVSNCMDVEQQGSSLDVGQQGSSLDVGQQGSSLDVGQQGSSLDVGQQGSSLDVGQQGSSLDDTQEPRDPHLPVHAAEKGTDAVDDTRDTTVRQEKCVSNSSSTDIKHPKSGHDSEKLSVHVNRTHFDSQDILVPWHLKDKGSKPTKVSSSDTNSGDSPTDQPVFHRYYHVFQDGELEKLVEKAGDVKVVKSYYDKGNWCVILSKESS